MIDGFPRPFGRLRLGGAPHLPLQALADELRSLTGRDVQPVPADSVPAPSGSTMAQTRQAAARVSALRAQVLSGEIDCAVHAYPDLPSLPDARLAIAATPARDDPRDVLVADLPFNELPRGAMVGTTSARRLAMLRKLRTDLSYHLIDADAQAMLGMFTDGHLAAVVCARPDLSYRQAQTGHVFGIEHMLPDPGQGALALECLAGRCDVVDTVHVLHDRRTGNAVTAERALLAAVNPDERFVIGGYAADDGHLVSLTAAVLSADGQHLVRTFGTCTSADAADLGRLLGADLQTQTVSWNASSVSGTREST
ncbi:hydroxymethylbilane synthase [Nonomuraea sp. NPDC046802]|uniref:hydroxymethylbilane synthase n=1 Tax=Nonomuraea sp. NPDC046802 TaxID=3154919 RepID=UPI0033C902E4